MKLDDVIVSTYNQSASGEGDAYESLELTYSKIDVEFTSRDKAGGGAKPKHVIYDLATGKGS
jgi:type VI protein secretion system component Hcp